MHFEQDYKKTRRTAFEQIRAALKPSLQHSSTDAVLAGGDSLDLLKKIPDESISLILTDPPYHATKKANIIGDTSFEKDEHYFEWMQLFINEWRRILRPNGSVYCFCDPSMSAKIEILFEGNFNILAHVVWTKPNEPGFDGWKQKMKKESLRQWYSHSERIIFAEPSQHGNLRRTPYGIKLKELRKSAGFSTYEAAEMIGAYGSVNHGGAVSNWEAGRNVPSREQYSKLCDAYLSSNILKSMPPYEDLIRPFNTDATKEFTDIWTFPSVRPYRGKHPAEKPLNMLNHIIESSSYEDDIVLDCFAGSGSTAIAALALNRKTISMDIDPKWISAISARLSEVVNLQNNHSEISINRPNHMLMPAISRHNNGLALFDINEIC